jgi:large subunit ribosomal protein L31
MKKNTHPENYRLVVFKDMSNGDTFVTKSCAETKDTIKIDGKEYPLIKREISSSSHPFYTGKMKLVDTAGRVDKFYKKFGKAALANKSAEAAVEGPADEQIESAAKSAEAAVEGPTDEQIESAAKSAEAAVEGPTDEQIESAAKSAEEKSSIEEDSDKE